MMRIARRCAWLGAVLVASHGMAADLTAQAAPGLPTDVTVWMVGNPSIDGHVLAGYTDVEFSIGGTDKNGPLETGERVDVQALQLQSLRAEERQGRAVWVRSFETRRAGDSAPRARGEIVLDRRTLAPLSSRIERGGSVTTFEYDWTRFEIRSSTGGEPESVDMRVLEAAAHETWVGAIDWSVGQRVMIPTILAGGGGKWWAVPRVTGSEDLDVGDGVRRSAWTIELDWWGMGRDEAMFTPGGGPNGSAGAGGKYWVLKDPVPGLPRVVRIQTEQDANVDRVIQIQGFDPS